MSPEPNHIDAAIADLEGWLERISTAIETLRALRVQGGSLPGGPPPVGVMRAAGATGELAHDTFFQMTVPDAAEKYLTLVKMTKPTSEVAASLLKGGLKSAAKNFTSMVNTVLSRESRFVRVNSEWGLSAWYPGMRKAATVVRKQATTGPPAQPEQTSERKPKGQTVEHGFSPSSLKGRTLDLLKAQSGSTLDAPTIAARLGVENVPSISAALAGLFASGLVTRPKKGQYQARGTQ